MLALPTPIIAIVKHFAPLFSKSVFQHALLLMVGTILTPGARTVANALRALGLQDRTDFQRFHRVLSRDKWSSKEAARILLQLLVDTFVPEGALVIGVDDTLERRRGDKIQAKGIYRDPARSSKSFFVKASGLRWISMMLLAPVPLAGRVWALPFLSVLAPSERYDQQRGRRHKSLGRWVMQMITLVRRWLPGRPLVLVADGGYAILALLDRCATFKNPVTFITRLRLDAALFEPSPAREAGQKGRPRKKGKRLPALQRVLDDPKTRWTTIVLPRFYSQRDRQLEIVSACCVWYHSGMPPVAIRYVLVRDPLGKLAPQALLCTNLSCDPAQILRWFVLRWQLEVTFQEVRAHLGVETQRQWSPLAILRCTPALLGLFSLVTVLGHGQWREGNLQIRQCAWYVKERATFSDVLASVRRELWGWSLFCTCSVKGDVQELQSVLMRRFADVLCYAP